MLPTKSNKSLFGVAVAIFLLALLIGCRPANPASETTSKEILVSAAVSLKDAFTEIATINEQRTNVKVRFNFGASGALQKQIESGAPSDVFVSAGTKQMDELSAKGLIDDQSRNNFARNVLVLIVPGKSTISSFQDLTKPEVTRIAIGNPKTVPAGQYTEQTFLHLKLLPQIQPRLIHAEDVRQVLNYVVRGEVDAGVVYQSDANSAGDQIKVVARAPDDSHDPILYPIAIVKDSRQRELAQKFIELVLSPEGQNILVKRGFMAISK